MAKIDLIHTINDIMEQGEVVSPRRSYLGYSGIGGNCARKTWYSFRWVGAESASRRMNRIWDRGHLEESRVADDLARVGCVISDAEGEVVGITGHVKGHFDGLATGVPLEDPEEILLFECKTMKQASYKKYIKVGLKKYSATYWQQVHSYMGHMKILKCLYVVTNKDTEARDYKIIDFDEDQFNEGERIALNIITAETPPDRIPNASPMYFECREMCSFSDVCHKGKEVDKNCRTCKHWDIEDDGIFSCSFHNEELSKQEQTDGCGMYEYDEECYGS